MSVAINKQDEVLGLKRPDLKGGQHPIETSEYIIDTLSISNLQAAMEKWIREKTPGAIIHGNPRLGKTYAIKYLKRLFAEDKELDIPIFSVNCRTRLRPNEGNFFSYLLKDLGHEFNEKGTVVAKRNRVYNLLLQAGLESKRRQVVIFFDDAQLLDTVEYQWLMDIFNELDRYDVKMTTMLVGQNELQYKRNSMTNAFQRQIVGRFMIHQFAFHGVDSKESLAYLLGSYDGEGDVEYPEGSGWSYTRYFFPLGFANGHRLEECVDDIWVVYEEAHAKMRKSAAIEIPMFYLTNLINEVFRKYGSNGEGLDWVNIQHWREALVGSSYNEFVEMV